MRIRELEQMPEITRVSSKGQVVIPRTVRKRMSIKPGSIFAMMSPKKDMLVLKKLDNRLVEEDIATIKVVERAWKDIEKGKFRAASKEDFLKELEKW